MSAKYGNIFGNKSLIGNRRNRKNETSSVVHYEMYKVSHSNISYHVSVYVSPFVLRNLKKDDIYLYVNTMTYKSFDFLEDEISQYIYDNEHTHIMQLDFEHGVHTIVLLRDKEFTVLILSQADSDIFGEALSQNKNRIDFGWAMFIINDYIFMIN